MVVVHRQACMAELIYRNTGFFLVMSDSQTVAKLIWFQNYNVLWTRFEKYVLYDILSSYKA